ncbi:hypothetical protein THAOC_24184 [Thalassiosira oceanica]|uniref:Uncharacterized protein n=1 Tax=Thalassiosira oceanica TaxID=159749 RepID=K0RUA5_THAOC|nr:hypothetical protein THAOC_24184 [Thalassiosira oceanica]|eukprot:EJK56004.1 hypothetical protein THAOC_24184 [Thalassiosira oceanica]
MRPSRRVRLGDKRSEWAVVEAGQSQDVTWWRLGSSRRGGRQPGPSTGLTRQGLDEDLHGRSSRVAKVNSSLWHGRYDTRDEAAAPSQPPILSVSSCLE